MSKNTALEYLDCSYNSLTQLDVSKNTALEYLDCSHNSLTQLDVSKNTVLERLLCSYNSLTDINLGSNSALTKLECASNNLTKIDVLGCPNLYNKNIFCDSDVEITREAVVVWDIVTLVITSRSLVEGTVEVYYADTLQPMPQAVYFGLCLPGLFHQV